MCLQNNYALKISCKATMFRQRNHSVCHRNKLPLNMNGWYCSQRPKDQRAAGSCRELVSLQISPVSRADCIQMFRGQVRISRYHSHGGAGSPASMTREKSRSRSLSMAQMRTASCEIAMSIEEQRFEKTKMSSCDDSFQWNCLRMILSPDQFLIALRNRYSILRTPDLSQAAQNWSAQLD